MVNLKSTILLTKIEGRTFASDRFHSFTNNRKLDAVQTKNSPKSWINIHFKTYPRFDKLSFNKFKAPNNSLGNLIRKRRTIRQFSGQPISKNDLAYLLFNSSGIIRNGNSLNESRRPYPSAGARYPLEVYPIILNCEGIANGLYHYNVKENSIEVLLQENLSDLLVDITGGEKWIKNATVAFVITGVLDRTRIKYSDRGYRYALIEAGHLGQNLSLLSTERSLGSCPIGGFIDEKINKLLDVVSQREFALYLILIGKT